MAKKKNQDAFGIYLVVALGLLIWGIAASVKVFDILADISSNPGKAFLIGLAFVLFYVIIRKKKWA